MNKKLGKFLSKVLPHYIKTFFFRQSDIHIELLSHSFLKRVLFFLKKSSFTQFKLLVDIVAIDFLNNYNRFEVVYSLLSTKYNSRIFVKVHLNNFFSLDTIQDIYPSANWLEREVWDMYGIFFYGHKDLRRILNNYGFNGYSLRKDFSLNGYISFRYDDLNKLILNEPIELSQFNLDFNYAKTPWRSN
jgi:NADH dehydrogenase (ubiquinone) Fe-S protein 3